VSCPPREPATEVEPAKRSVLVVDDEPAVCSLLSEGLASEGYECQAVSSGQMALSLMEGKSFDIVLVDLRMPGMSGMEFLEQARGKYPRSAFLMVTGEDDIRQAVQAMRLGAADYLLKPVQLEAVAVSVQRALEIKRMELELESYRHNLEGVVKQRTKQLQAAMRRIEMTYDETLEALGGALDLRDAETAGHSQRVSRYCLEIAKAMGCSSDQLKQIARGSYLHDIGKIGIPDTVLLKEGKLNADETEVMQTHARIGYNMVSRIAFLAGAAEIVLTHQERYDGTGYPQGLVGDEIPVGSRIFAVADTLDAMTSDRPYRRALPFSAAKAEIMRESGRQFDPEVVRAFLSISENVWEKIRQDVGGRQRGVRAVASRPAFHWNQRPKQ
jgi:response regulator RpfG family c-di-GMP phosphodiesterase